jgi:hypothetical protein
MEYYSGTFINIVSKYCYVLRARKTIYNFKFHGFCLFCKWTSPALLAFCYYKGYISIDYIHAYTRFFTFFGSLIVAAYLFRGIYSSNLFPFNLIISSGVGRYANDDYRKFIIEHSKLVNQKFSSDHRSFLLKYDFSLSNWPAEFKSKQQPPVL